MALLLFFIILSALVIVHELGHFGAAKFFGVRVDEFGLGYPPRAKRLFSWKGTVFTLNWLPFGGFVKIFGENYESGEVSSKDSFQHKNRGAQAVILISGVVGNFIFAWFLFSLGFMTGLPAPENLDLPITNPQTVITTVLADSPADLAGLKSGDAILSLSRGNDILTSPITPESASSFITNSASDVTLDIKRGDEHFEKTITPASGIWTEGPAIGVAMEIIGTVELGFFQSIKEGFTTSINLTIATARGLEDFFWHAIVGRADLSTVTGPVGLVGMVGDASRLGFGHLLTFTALISINLCLINLLPFPALDGGRLLFVGIEALTRKKIPSKVFGLINLAGFGLLILLMILVTVHDVSRIF